MKLLRVALALVAFAIGNVFAQAPVPLLEKGGAPVQWWFAFKLNGKAFPGCDNNAMDKQVCTFDKPGTKPNPKTFGLQYLFASSNDQALKKGSGCFGQTDADPLGATFGDLFRGSYNYVVWNDQPKGGPRLRDCSADTCPSKWAHSKGLLAWNQDGEGMILQVTTPAWPESASHDFPRKGDGNTLGCVQADNNIWFSQHFFALRLTKDDVISVAKALQNASVPTDLPKTIKGKPPADDYHSIARTGPPTAIQHIVETLHTAVTTGSVLEATLSSGVKLISKPANVKAPPWHLVSARLGGVDLKVATFWDPNNDMKNTVKGKDKVSCLNKSFGNPGSVTNVSLGHWQQTSFGLTKGGPNHAKIGISTSGSHHYVVFGDMNQSGSINGPDCTPSQNGRGGLFFVIDDPALHAQVSELLSPVHK